MTRLAKTGTWNLYDPDWEQKYNEHLSFVEKELWLPPELRDQELIDFHTGEWQRAWRSQFKNAPEYAAHILDPLQRKAKAGQLVWVQEDLSRLETVEDVHGLYERIDESLKDQEKDLKGGMPTDVSGNFFTEQMSHSANARIHSSQGSILGTPGYTDTVVTLEEKDGQLNVCLSHLKDFGTTSVYNAIESVASTLYNNGLKGKYPDPKKINWHIHSSASNHCGKENFCKVNMEFSNGQFSNPQFQHLSEVPNSVKMAVWNAAQDEMGLDLDDRKMPILLNETAGIGIDNPQMK